MEKLILVHYINVSELSKNDGDIVISEYETKLSNLDENIINIVYPHNFGVDTKVECLNPKFISEDYNKLKMILIHYIFVGGFNNVTANKIISDYEVKFSNLDENIINIFYPTYESDTKVECINPKLVSEEEYKQVKEILERNQQIVNDIIFKSNK